MLYEVITTRLPDYLAFFGGKRLVPIMTGLFSLAVAYVCGFVWPLFQQGIDTFGHGVANSGALGQFVYGLLNRALIPIGLHHVMNSIFWFGLGECTKLTYVVVITSYSIHYTKLYDVRRKLMVLGLLPQSEIRVIRTAPFGDPLQIATASITLSVQKQLALDIEVACL